MTAIHPDTTLGPVHLRVRDLGGALDFYERRLGLRARKRTRDSATLAAGDADLLVLVERGYAPRPRRATGLYHVALRVPSRRELARTLEHLLAAQVRLHGASDHGVSEALYLADPEGNGIEIYRDRPRDEWPYVEGVLTMTTDPLAIDDLLAESGGAPWGGMDPGTRVGHVHLHVSRLDEAERFYRDALGFEVTARYGDQAVFLSAGGYHHHLGLNTWLGVGLQPPPENAVGLDHFVVNPPDTSALDAVLARTRDAGVEGRHEGDGTWLRDPAGNRLVLAAQSVSARA
jgi:catechol 2,3-dioxygenase